MVDIPLHDDPSRPAFKGRTLLERAIAVISFTPVSQLSVKGGELAAAFQEAIRRDYPLLEDTIDTFLNVHVSEAGVRSDQEDRRKWLYRDIDRNWTVALTQDSLSLEGNRAGYSSWPKFVERLSMLVHALQSTIGPSHVQRLGVRYLNTAEVEGDEDPRRVCAPQLTSITGNSALTLSDLLWAFEASEGQLIMRSGVMPPNASYDPSMFGPRDKKVWYLDIDVANSHMIEFDPKTIEEQLRKLASRLHAVYYWAMPNGEGE
ncbi:TIGR04255 family protein [Sphingorhabdus sp. IMCC26285]|uniref:TIGR04255 family protein n=1 Tax=Sphingorhabdus profundilacus TaxID=2509718 RepID=A0A6I4M738_9SPHN|nr:TIGR04255 family protein [Sphingorhabdus profundilacus]MVZ98498.1 TIGR04255 family protein [Sphingorhabdus profundilacus]